MTAQEISALSVLQTEMGERFKETSAQLNLMVSRLDSLIGPDGAIPKMTLSLSSITDKLDSHLKESNTKIKKWGFIIVAGIAIVGFGITVEHVMGGHELAVAVTFLIHVLSGKV